MWCVPGLSRFSTGLSKSLQSFLKGVYSCAILFNGVIIKIFVTKEVWIFIANIFSWSKTGHSWLELLFSYQLITGSNPGQRFSLFAIICFNFQNKLSVDIGIFWYFWQWNLHLFSKVIICCFILIAHLCGS